MKKQAQRKRTESAPPSPHALELFEPRPNVLYSLDAAAHIAGVSRRSILVYCRAGLVRSVSQPPYGVMAFTEEAIHTVRRIEHVRAVHSPGLALLKAMFDLLDEVENLRAEVRFLRRH
jgi:DNA-binding transcriptional MerR regulator